jgi:hypothetical protein
MCGAGEASSLMERRYDFGDINQALRIDALCFWSQISE